MDMLYRLRWLPGALPITSAYMTALARISRTTAARSDKPAVLLSPAVGGPLPLAMYHETTMASNIQFPSKGTLINVHSVLGRDFSRALGSYPIPELDLEDEDDDDWEAARAPLLAAAPGPLLDLDDVVLLEFREVCAAFSIIARWTVFKSARLEAKSDLHLVSAACEVCNLFIKSKKSASASRIVFECWPETWASSAANRFRCCRMAS